MRSTEHLDRLLERLNSGDASAAEQVFRDYQPYLHMLVRRQLRAPLRAKFDSMDVVQSVWADVLEGVRGSGWRFVDRGHLLAFLTRLTRNRFIDRCRKHRTALSHEESLDSCLPAGAVEDQLPRPSQMAEQNELWERLLALSLPSHHELLRLRRQGLTISEIAERTEMHPSSVRRILYQLARRLALEKEAVAEAPPSSSV